MTKRINNSLPYPYSQFFNEMPAPIELDCLEEKPKQLSSNNNNAFILLIIIVLLFNSNKTLEVASVSDTDLNPSKSLNVDKDNYYE